MGRYTRYAVLSTILSIALVTSAAPATVIDDAEGDQDTPFDYHDLHEVRLASDGSELVVILDVAELDRDQERSIYNFTFHSPTSLEQHPHEIECEAGETIVVVYPETCELTVIEDHDPKAPGVERVNRSTYELEQTFDPDSDTWRIVVPYEHFGGSSGDELTDLFVEASGCISDANAHVCLRADQAYGTGSYTLE